MTTLVLGVVDAPYAPGEEEPAPTFTKKGRLRKNTARRLARQAQTGAVNKPVITTAEVAQALEDRYHVMAVYVETNRDDIMAACVHGMEGSLEDLFAGSPPRDPFAGLSQEVADGFKVWLGLGLIESAGIEGVPTKAAQERKSLRFKAKVGPNERPSFVDTGAYEAAMTTWVEK